MPQAQNLSKDCGDQEIISEFGDVSDYRVTLTFKDLITYRDSQLTVPQLLIVQLHLCCEIFSQVAS